MAGIRIPDTPFSGVLSALSIDADKDWNAKALTNVASAVFNDFVTVGGTSELQFADATALIGVNGDDDILQLGVNAMGFYGQAPVVQRAKASYNNWAALSDVVQALVDLNLFDAA